MRVLKLLAAGYALAVYAFIFLPVAVLVLFSFQEACFPCHRSRDRRSHDAVLGDRRLTAGLVNSVAVASCRRSSRFSSASFSAYGFARYLSARRDFARADHCALDGQLPDHRDGPADHVQRAGCRQSLRAAGIGHVVINFVLRHHLFADGRPSAECRARRPRPRRAQLAGARARARPDALAGAIRELLPGHDLLVGRVRDRLPAHPVRNRCRSRSGAS